MLTFDHSGLPLDLIGRFRTAFGVDSFIESGTFRGASACHAATIFSQVTTIEKAEAFYREAKSRPDAHGVRFLLGDTREHLAHLLTPAAAPAVIWLDAHWSGMETAGEGDECPLLAEIALIAASGVPHFVLIDDARFYLSPPPAPHNPEQWPSLADVLHALAALAGNPYVVVFQDVIIAVPSFARDLVLDYCRQAYTGGVSLPGYERPGLKSRVASRVKRLISK